MPTYHFDIPTSLMIDIINFSDENDIDRDTFVNWAVAEKIGELKFMRMLKFNIKDSNPSQRPPIYRPVPENRNKGNR
jgi:hypothetical protein